jgi:hypothetical protein
MPQPVLVPFPAQNRKIIWSADNPNLGAPLTYDQESLAEVQQAGNRSWLTVLTARAYFKLDIVAQTTEAPDSYWREAWVNWEFDATGKVTPAITNQGTTTFQWTSEGAKVTPPPGGSWNAVNAFSPEDTTGPIYNDVDKVLFKQA